MISRTLLCLGANNEISCDVITKNLAKGVRVIALTRDSSKLIPRLEECRSHSQFEILNCDLNSTESIDSAISDLKDRGIFLDGILLTSSIQQTKPFQLLKVEEITKHFNINVVHQIYFLKMIFKKKIINEESSLIYLSSVSAHEASPGQSLYAATKSAMEAFLISISSELAPKRIRVNIVVSGLLSSGMGERFLSKLSSSDNIERSYPLGIGQPSNIADMINFLFSSESSWITGQRFFVDGGHMKFQGF